MGCQFLFIRRHWFRRQESWGRNDSRLLTSNFFFTLMSAFPVIMRTSPQAQHLVVQIPTVHVRDGAQGVQCYWTRAHLHTFTNFIIYSFICLYLLSRGRMTGSFPPFVLSIGLWGRWGWEIAGQCSWNSSLEQSFKLSLWMRAVFFDLL